MVFFVDGMISNVENTMDSVRTGLEIINNFSNNTRYEVSTQISILLTDPGNGQ